MKKLILGFLIMICSAVIVNAQNRNENLYEAVSKNDRNAVMQHLKDGGDVNYVKSEGPWMKVNLLTTAVNKGNLEMAKLLIENKADVNWKDGFNTTALMYAANKGSKDIVVLLLDNGANMNDNDGKGNTVLTAAKESKNEDLVKFLEGKLKEK